MRELFACAALIVFFAAAAPSVFAQSCPGSSVIYIVRDKKGKPMDAADPKLTFAGGAAGASSRWTLTEKGVTRGRAFRLPAELDLEKMSIAGLYTTAMCNFREPVTLNVTLGGKTMELTFNFPRMGSMESAQFMVDSLPFRPGKYEIALELSADRGPGFYPANGWSAGGKRKP